MTDTSNRLTGSDNFNSAQLAALWGDPAPAAPTLADTSAATVAATAATTAANIATAAAASANTALANLAGAPTDGTTTAADVTATTPTTAPASYFGFSLTSWMTFGLVALAAILLFRKHKK